MGNPQGVAYGEYYLLGRLAMGGMAEVFLAKALLKGPHSDELLALKRTLPTLASQSDFASMFMDEARIALGLKHPNICRVYDQGHFGDQLYIVMEFLHGKDLKVIGHRAQQVGEPIPYPFLALIIAGIADALEYAHTKKNEKGEPLAIVHRDVSPQNILVCYDGSSKLIDFGIARAKDRIAKTRVGVVKGKFAYMSPEQAVGATIDHRSDIFGLGVVFYEMIAGDVPFKGESDFSTLKKIAKADYIPVRKLRSDIPPPILTIVEKALARDVNERFQSASEMSNALRRYLDTESNVKTSAVSTYLRKLFREDYVREQERIKAFMDVRPPSSAVSSATKVQAKRKSLGPQIAIEESQPELRFKEEATIVMQAPNLAAGYKGDLSTENTEEVELSQIVVEESTLGGMDDAISEILSDVDSDDIFDLDTAEIEKPIEEKMKDDGFTGPYDFEEPTLVHSVDVAKLMSTSEQSSEQPNDASTVPPMGSTVVLSADELIVEETTAPGGSAKTTVSTASNGGFQATEIYQSDPGSQVNEIDDDDVEIDEPITEENEDMADTGEDAVMLDDPIVPLEAPLRRRSSRIGKRRRGVTLSNVEVAVLMFVAFFGVLFVAMAYYHAAVGLPPDFLPGPLQDLFDGFRPASGARAEIPPAPSPPTPADAK